MFMTALQISDLHVHYPNTAESVLTGVSMDITAGEVVALLGASGSGKTTLFKAITGFAPISSGSIQVYGTQVKGIRRRALRSLRADVGQVSQHYGLVGKLSTLTNVLMGSLHHAGPMSVVGTFHSADRKRAHELLDLVGLGDKSCEPARQLSGGQQQRVSIARVLMQNPRMILADEPVAALDPLLGGRMLELFTTIAAEESIPVILSLHQPQLALNYAQRIIGLHEGGISLDSPSVRLSPADLTQFYEQEEQR